jgi:hypothetical protein
VTELIKFVAPRVVKFTAGLIVGYVIQNYVIPAAQGKLNEVDDDVNDWGIFAPQRWET